MLADFDPETEVEELFNKHRPKQDNETLVEEKEETDVIKEETKSMFLRPDVKVDYGEGQIIEGGPGFIVRN